MFKRWSRLGYIAILALLVGVSFAGQAQNFGQGEDPAASGELPRFNSLVTTLAGSHPDTPLALIVMYHQPSYETIAVLEQLQVGTLKSLPAIGAVAVKMHASDALALQDDPNVAYVTVDAPVRSALDVAREVVEQSSLPTNLSAFTGEGVTVAVLDSGIFAHHDLTGRVVASVDFIGSADPKINTLLPAGMDPYGHGTHVAGIISGSGQVSDGLYRGLAPGASLVSVRVLNEFGAGTTSGVIEGLAWIVDNKDLFG